MEKASQVDGPAAIAAVDSSSNDLHPSSHSILPTDRRRRICLLASLCLIATIVAIGIIILVLALTVFKIRKPTVTVQSMSFTGVFPRFDMQALDFRINVTLDIMVAVHNPNYASFRHLQGATEIQYREKKVGEADIAEGRIPPRGTETVRANVTLESGNFTTNIPKLGEDVFAGKLAFDTYSRVPGRVRMLGGLVKRDAVATSTCKVVIGVPQLNVVSQDCSQSTKAFPTADNLEGEDEDQICDDWSY